MVPFHSDVKSMFLKVALTAVMAVTAAAVVGGDLRKAGVKQDLNDQLVDLAAGIALMRLRPFLDEVADDRDDVVGEFRVLDTHEVA